MGRRLTADLNCSQQTLVEGRKGKLFLALSGRTSVLQGCQFQALVSYHCHQSVHSFRPYILLRYANLLDQEHWQP